MNSSMATGQMAQMKWMMYLMPIMFLGFFNNYAAGLTYYYFLANMFTMTQQYFMMRFVDEKGILAQIEANKKKPAKPKSKFQKKANFNSSALALATKMRDWMSLVKTERNLNADTQKNAIAHESH